MFARYKVHKKAEKKVDAGRKKGIQCTQKIGIEEGRGKAK
ncbi:MAG: hypothetical protein ACFWT2_12025 [Thermoanaerobacterium thermosaccharolyticum]|jgi:hypothetical protein